MITLQEDTPAQRVELIQLIRRVRLQRVGYILLIGILRDTVEENIAQRIGHEIQARVARGQGSLNVQVPLRVLPAQDGEVVQFALIFIEGIARIGGLTVYVERRAVRIDDARCLVAASWNLKRAGRTRQHRAQAVALIENVFQVRKLMMLRGVIVIRARAAVRRLDAEIVAQKVRRNEIVESAGAAAVVEARLDRSVAASVN